MSTSQKAKPRLLVLYFAAHPNGVAASPNCLSVRGAVKHCRRLRARVPALKVMGTVRNVLPQRQVFRSHQRDEFEAAMLEASRQPGYVLTIEQEGGENIAIIHRDPRAALDLQQLARKARKVVNS